MNNLIPRTSFNLKNKFSRLFTKSHIQVSRKMSSKWSNPQEIRIPIPYGHIAAKAWGREDGEKVLAVHGWQSNAGTFDALIPHLKSNLYIVAFDALGNGLSSHKPQGSFYNYFEMVLDIHRIVKYLNWDSFSIIGHSMGGGLSLLYASIYPENVHNVVVLDKIKPSSQYSSMLPDTTHLAIGEMLTVEEKASKPAPVYTREEARDRLRRAVLNELTVESADIMLKRACKESKCGKGVVFTRDIRVQWAEDLQRMSHEDCKEFMSKLKCNLLFMLATSTQIPPIAPELQSDFFNLYKKVAPTVEVIDVEGNHFFLLNNPERTAPHIDSFFSAHGANKSKI